MIARRWLIERLKVSGRILVVLLLVAPVLMGRPLEAQEAATNRVYNFNFADGSQGWAVDFADYPAGQEEFYRLAYDFAKLPRYLAVSRFAIRLQGNNHSDDLCMFMRRRITGLRPNTDYSVLFRVALASNSPSDSFGIGGAPGEGVAVKVGAALIRPEADPLTRDLSIDKGNQSVGGDDAIVIGHLGVDTPASTPVYRFKTLQNTNREFVFRTDARGVAWLFFATDSGFEGMTQVYVVSFRAEFAPID